MARFSSPGNLSNSMGGDGKGRISKTVWDNGSMDLALAPDGTLYLVYAESGGGPFARRHIRAAHLPDGALGFTQSAPVTSRLPAPYVSAAFPEVKVDATGRLTVLVNLFRHPARSQALGLVSARDGGSSFTPVRVLPESEAQAGVFNSSQQGLLMNKLALGSDGAVVVANRSLQPDVGSRVWVIKTH